MPLAAPEVLDRLVMLTAATKTFNIAGTLTGNVIIPDDGLRRRFAAAHLATGTSPNRFGALMATAAYERRRRLGRRALPLPRRQRRGLRRRHRRDPRPQPRCRSTRPISPGSTSPAPAWRRPSSPPAWRRTPASPPATAPTFGEGGEACLRFNLGTPRARVEEAVRRLQAAFADLQ